MTEIFTLYHFEPREPLENALFTPFVTGKHSERFLNDAKSSVPPINDCCELAYFHIWRNIYALGLRDNDHIGFQQYRRMFYFDIAASPQHEFQQTDQSFYTLTQDGFAKYRSDLQNATLEQRQKICEFITRHDVVTIKPWPIDSIAKHFQSSHGEPATIRLREVMAKRGYTIDNTAMFHPCCMFIMRVELFDRYMREFMRFIDEFGMPAVGEPGHDARIYGFALERFWSLWYREHKPDMVTAEIPFVYCHAKIQS